MKYWHPKLKWGQTLKAGDLIHDCRGKNVAIKSIGPVYCTPSWFMKFLSYVPTWIPYLNKLENVVTKYFGQLSDFEIETEDGNYCSLIYCCDTPN